MGGRRLPFLTTLTIAQCSFVTIAFIVPSCHTSSGRKAILTPYISAAGVIPSTKTNFYPALKEEAEECDDDDDEECSIDNLDACVASDTNDECCIDDDDACEVRLSSNKSEIPTLKSSVAMPIVEVQLAFLVVLSAFLVGLGTLPSLPPMVASITNNVELFISAIFTLEYLIRWSLENFTFKYVVRPLAIIDLIAILPGFIKIVAFLGFVVPPSFGLLINLRLLRILRLQRVLVDYETFEKFEIAIGLDPSNTRPYQLQLARIVISIYTLLSITAGLIYSAEHVSNPEVPDYFTALYFSLTTLTTVGFGDIHPVTTAGRWVVSGAILIGSAVIPAQAAALVEALLDREGEQGKAKNISKNDINVDATVGVTVASEKVDGYYVAEGRDSHLESIMARMDSLESKMDETNERMDRILVALEAKELR
jgi:voltage-gated potassium channel